MRQISSLFDMVQLYCFIVRYCSIYIIPFLYILLGHCGKSTASARVVLVATHADTANCQRNNASSEYVSTEADAILEAALLRFGHIFDVHESVYVMDAHVVGSQSMKSLKQYICNVRNQITQVSISFPFSCRRNF